MRDGSSIPTLPVAHPLQQYSHRTHLPIGPGALIRLEDGIQLRYFAARRWAGNPCDDCGGMGRRLHVTTRAVQGRTMCVDRQLCDRRRADNR